MASDLDVYSLFMGDEPTAQERAAALVQALRGQQAQAGGDRRAAALFSIGANPLGQGLVRQANLNAHAMGEEAQQSRQMLGQAGQHRAGNVLQAALKAAEAQRAEANAKRAHAWQQERDVGQNAEAMKRAYVMAGTQRATAGRLAGNDLENDVEALSKRLEQTPAMRNDLETLQSFAGESDVPGVGPVASRIPDWASWLLSSDALRLRQAQKGILGTIIKEQSGTAASEGEIARKLAELGMGPGATDEQFRLGLQRLTKNVRDSVRSKEAGARPEALKIARERGVVTSADIPADIPAAPQAAAPVWTPESQKRLEELLRAQAAEAGK